MRRDTMTEMPESETKPSVNLLGMSQDELRGLVLGCWCAPRACHGDLLVRLANASMVERERWLALAA